MPLLFDHFSWYVQFSISHHRSIAVIKMELSWSIWAKQIMLHCPPQPTNVAAVESILVIKVLCACTSRKWREAINSEKARINLHGIVKHQWLLFVNCFTLAVVILKVYCCFVQVGDQMAKHKGMVPDSVWGYWHLLIHFLVRFNGKIKLLPQVWWWYGQ